MALNTGYRIVIAVNHKVVEYHPYFYELFSSGLYPDLVYPTLEVAEEALSKYTPGNNHYVIIKEYNIPIIEDDLSPLDKMDVPAGFL